MAWKDEKKEKSSPTHQKFKRPLPKLPVDKKEEETVSTRVIKAGYLMKHTQSKVTRHTWVRRYFCLLHLKDSRLAQEEYVLAYYNGEKLNEKGTVVTDIQTSTVRRLNGRPLNSGSSSNLPDLQKEAQTDAPCTFEIISPQRQLVLQAEDEETMQSWITAFQGAIASALTIPQRSLPPSPVREKVGERKDLTLQTNHSISSSAPNSASVFKKRNKENALARHASSSHHHKSHRSAAQKEAEAEVLEILADIKSLAVNQSCADCGGAQPVWASINLGILLCIECSGIHRSLGVHVSKVRSLELDKWEASNAILLQQLGNRTAASIFEASVPTPCSTERATPLSTRSL